MFTIIIFNGLTGKIQGTVKDEELLTPIVDVNVTVLGTELGAATDEDGNFFIFNVSAGKYKIEISCLGYRTKIFENVVVEVDQTSRLAVELAQTPIEIEPITITSEMPTIKKDMVGTTYIVRKTELSYLPIDYAANLVTFQPAVANVDTAIHVRGGRATEVQYLIDNVPIIDPQNGDLAINLSKGIVDEVIFLPGGFDVEYGRAMSGVINMLTAYPQDRIGLSIYGKTERTMPFYYDFGYENYQSSINVPLNKRFKGLFAIDVMHTDDWDPRLYVLPHKERDDYSFYGKWLFIPSGKLRVSVSGAKSRSQFDRYNTEWMFNLDHYRSDMRQGDLAVFSLNYLPDTRYLGNLTVSRLNTQRIYGVREPGDYGIFDNFTFRDYRTLVWPYGGVDNPFGAYIPYMPIQGDYPEYQSKSSQIIKANLNFNLQIHRFHELKAGGEYGYLDLNNFSCFTIDSLHQLIDDYQYYPVEYSIYVQDNIDYKGSYAKIGCRYDYFSSDIDDVEPKRILSPRVGFSFMVTDRFLFRTNIGRYAQPPLYDQIYSYYNILPFPSYITIPLIGNPNLEPEKTTSYEIGLQGEIEKNLTATFNIFYKDVTDLIGTRFVSALPQSYASYFNVEYANVKGIEAILEFVGSKISGKISYTLAYARGSSSYAQEVYYRYYYDDPDTTFTPPASDYFLDFDQRHRFFIQGNINLPLQTNLYIYGYFGPGFPYTPPGFEGKYEERNIQRFEFQRQIDCILSKSFSLSGLSLTVNLEVMNLLDARYEMAQHYPLVPLEEINPWDFTGYISLGSSFYHPAADLNHNGVITPYEQYTSYYEAMAATDDWINAYSSPRRARLGVTIKL